MADDRSTMTVRPTVAADVAALGFEAPFRFKGLTGLVGDRVVGVAGVGYQPEGGLIAFAQLTDECRAHRVTLHRAALRFLASLEVRELVALADPKVPAATAWLERLGFKPVTRNGEQVWLWQK